MDGTVNSDATQGRAQAWRFATTRSTLKLAGGAAELHDRFASRLDAFFKERGAAFEVRSDARGVMASRRGVISLTADWAPSQSEDAEPVEYRLSASTAPHLTATALLGFFAADDAEKELRATCAAAADLIAQWPEFEARGARRDAGGWDVVLLDPGVHRMTVVREIRLLTGGSLAQSFDWMTKAPTTLMVGASRETAALFKRQLEGVGARVDVSPTHAPARLAS